MAQRWILAGWLALVATVVLLSLIPAAAPPGMYGADKILHLLVFLALAAIPAAAVTGPWWVLLAAVLFLVGGGIEVAQSFVPSRVASGIDWAMDAVGIGLGAAAGRAANPFLCRVLPSLRPAGAAD